MRDVSEYLIDIHGQHENQFLFNPSKHLSFVDFFVDNSLKDDFSTKYRAYREKLDRLENLKKNISNLESESSNLQNRLEELKNTKIQ